MPRLFLGPVRERKLLDGISPVLALMTAIRVLGGGYLLATTVSSLVNEVGQLTADGYAILKDALFGSTDMLQRRKADLLGQRDAIDAEIADIEDKLANASDTAEQLDSLAPNA